MIVHSHRVSQSVGQASSDRNHIIPFRLFLFCSIFRILLEGVVKIIGFEHCSTQSCLVSLCFSLFSPAVPGLAWWQRLAFAI